MSLTRAEARDAIIALVDAAWKASGVTGTFPMHYDDVKSDRPGESGSTSDAGSWARTTIRHFTSPLLAFGSGVARRRYESTGLLTVQIFTPFGDGHVLGDAASKVVTDVLRGYEGSADGISFFDIDSPEVGEDGPWFNQNVTANFMYQEVAT